MGLDGTAETRARNALNREKNSWSSRVNVTVFLTFCFNGGNQPSFFPPPPSLSEKKNRRKDNAAFGSPIFFHFWLCNNLGKGTDTMIPHLLQTLMLTMLMEHGRAKTR